VWDLQDGFLVGLSRGGRESGWIRAWEMVFGVTYLPEVIQELRSRIRLTCTRRYTLVYLGLPNGTLQDLPVESRFSQYDCHRGRRTAFYSQLCNQGTWATKSIKTSAQILGIRGEVRRTLHPQLRPVRPHKRRLSLPVKRVRTSIT
jgi:hypothetical protein